jgi:hypothetical protein
LLSRRLPGVAATAPTRSPLRSTVQVAPAGVVDSVTVSLVPSTTVAQAGKSATRASTANLCIVVNLRVLLSLFCNVNVLIQQQYAAPHRTNPMNSRWSASARPSRATSQSGLSTAKRCPPSRCTGRTVAAARALVSGPSSCRGKRR